MKRLLVVSLILATTLVIVQCHKTRSRSPKAPYNVMLSAATDTTVRVTWRVPADGTPDLYRIDFKASGNANYESVAVIPETTCTHYPEGRTGLYRVAAEFDGERYPADSSPTTEPVKSNEVTVAELNAAGNAGYGWDRKTGRAHTFSMTDIASAGAADFYVTDFKPAGVSELPYSIASPEMGPSDPGGVVPTGTWRTSHFTDPLPGENVPLPADTQAMYFHYSDISGQPCFFGCRTRDGNYAFIKVNAVDSVNCWVTVESWFQMVPGLRLVSH